MNWVEAALAAYVCRDPAQKCVLVRDLPIPHQVLASTAALPSQPGRPQRPELVHASDVPRRKLGSQAGRVALIHAVAHIEFNAINLALDAALRFTGLPLAFYQDWISVAQDEARHHQMLAQRLSELDAQYGDVQAHNGLWQMAEKTADDPLIRMALVPRVLEARGLDVTPGMIKRLKGTGDHATVECLEIILQEEIRHVEIGSHWFRHLCALQSIEPDQHFLRLLREHLPGMNTPANQLNLAARQQAGFSAHELAQLGQL